MMNAKFYAAVAACLGLGYGGGVAVTQQDIDRAARANIQCEDTQAKAFRAPQPMNSKGKVY